MTTSAMPTIRELVPLLYRARWIRSHLSGEVVSHRVHHRFEERDSGTLLVAPGGRYRANVIDQDGDAELMISEGPQDEIPFRELLVPSWLLAGYDLDIVAVTEHIGRAVYAVKAVPRHRGTKWANRLSDCVEALVDVGLGILLKYRKVGPRERIETAEFTSLRVDDAGSAEQELAPWQISPGFNDQQVNLLYRPVSAPLRFSGQLRERSDQEAMRRLGESALASTDMDERTRWLRQSAEDEKPENIDLAARLALALPGTYRIEAITDSKSRPTCVSCDGTRLWLVYPDHVAIRPAAPLPAGIQRITDLAWLLDACQLSSVTNVTVDGRPALRVLAGAPTLIEHGPLSEALVVADEVEVSIDVELGIALRQVWYLEEIPVLSTELSKVNLEFDPAMFQVQPPPGMRVITAGPLAEAGLSPAEVALTLVKGASRLALEFGRRWSKRHSD